MDCGAEDSYAGTRSRTTRRVGCGALILSLDFRACFYWSLRFWGWIWKLPEPIGTALIVIACVLSLLASWQESRWWLAIPVTVFCVAGFLFYVAAHAY